VIAVNRMGRGLSASAAGVCVSNVVVTQPVNYH
jgi:hypothetical protein